MQITRNLVLALALALGALAGLACDNDPGDGGEGGAGGGSGGEAALDPVIEGLTVAPALVRAGDPATISWTVRNAEHVELHAVGGAEIVVEGGVPTGEAEVRPLRATLYELTAIGATGTIPARQRLSVDVDTSPLPAPIVERFTVTPAELPEGAELMLAWSTSLTSRLFIEGPDGATVATSDQASGTATNVPVRSGLYVLHAFGAGGEARATAAVTVTRAPRIVSFVSDPASALEPGASAALRWRVERATSIRITDEAGTPLVESPSSTGEITVTPAGRVEYTLTATGPGGSSTALLVVGVGARIESFTLTPSFARVGDQVTLAWRTSGADAGTLTGPDGFTRALDAAGIAAGNATAIAGTSGDFVLEALRDGAPRRWSLRLTTTRAPRIHGLVATPTQATGSAARPVAVHLSWTADGADSASLVASSLGAIDVSALDPADADLDLEITADTLFELVVTNADGSARTTATVDVVPPATVQSFTASAQQVPRGEPVTLAWATRDAASVRLERDGVALPVDPAMLSGSYVDAPLSAASYVLVATNGLGEEVSSAPLSVVVATPAVLTFTVAPAAARASAPLTFSWTAAAATVVTVQDAAGGILCTAAQAQLAAGSCTVPTPSAPGPQTFTLRAANGVGDVDIATASIDVSDGPLLLSFTLAPDPGAVGAPVTLGWSVTNDAFGTAPNVTLTGDGTPLALGAQLLSGIVASAPLTIGLHTFVLTATTPGTTPATRTLTVEARPLPVVSSFLATPAVLDTAFGTLSPTSELTWTTTTAVSVDLFALDPAGAAILPALLHEVDPALVAAGAFTVQPPARTTYRLVATGPLGDLAAAELELVVDPTAIRTFTADTQDVVAGALVTLSWTTQSTDLVTLSPLGPQVTDPAVPFVDVSALRSAVPVVFSAPDEGSQTITLPGGFAFPWEGAPRTQLRIGTNGWLSFDVASAGNASANAAFPTAAGTRYVHLAPFWDDLHVKTTGTAWVNRFNDAGGDRVVLQWKNLQFAASTVAAPADLNFEVVLWADGAFEYRYGSMTATGATAATNQARADGAQATIGEQNPAGTRGLTLSHNVPVAGGSGGRALRIQTPPTPPNGSATLAVVATTTFTLTATGPDGTDTASLGVTVWPAATVTAPVVTPLDVQQGLPASLSWSSNADHVLVTDAIGGVVCDLVGAAAAAGPCALPTDALGAQNFTITATLGFAGNVAIAVVPVTVNPLLRLDSFAAAPAVVPSGGSTVLSWSGVGATSATLVATPGGAIDVSAVDPNAGSIALSPSETTTYLLTLEAGAGRTREGTLDVVVEATIDSFTASAAQMPVGGSVTLDWQTTSAQQVTVTGRGTIEGAALPFLDVSTSPTAVNVGFAASSDESTVTVTFPNGFAFPFDGTPRTRARLTTNGWLSFDTASASTIASNVAMGAGAASAVHLAPLWDNLNSKATGSGWMDAGTDADGDYVVLQWKGFQFNDSSAAAVANLNFEIVLRPDGRFEYRYGVMTSAGATALTNQARADGASATIGWQLPAGTVGEMRSRDVVAPGGLAGTALRIALEAPGDGSFAVSPPRSTDYTLCVDDSVTVTCQTQRVVVVAAGALVISELLPLPDAALVDGDAELIELRNLSSEPIDVGGMVLGSAGDAGLLLPPATIAPGGFLVVAGSADPLLNGGALGAVAAAGAITLSELADDVVLTYGALELDRVTWDATWAFAAGTAKKLDGSRFTGDPAANDAAASWCVATEAFGAQLASPGLLGAGCRFAAQGYDVDAAAQAPYLDLSVTGAVLAGAVGAVPGGLGFTMPFFGVDVTELTFSRHGWVGFGPTTAADPVNDSIPDATTPQIGLVASFWDSHSTTVGRVLHEQRNEAGRDVHVVTWEAVPLASGAGSVTHQVQLWADGEIVTIIRAASGTNAANYAGASASAGIEAIGGASGVPFSFNTAVLTEGRTVRYTPR